MKRLVRMMAVFAILSVFAVACGAAEDVADGVAETAGDVGDAAADAADGATDAVEDVMDDDDAADGDAADGDAAAGSELLTDIGVSDDEIRIGLSADLSGPFSGLVSALVTAQIVYFDRINAEGGIAGRQIVPVTLDSAYDVPTHLENYAELSQESDDGVVMLSQSTGSPHTSAIADDLKKDDLIALPLSWYSGWGTDFGANVLEMYTNYCIEGMNGVEFLVEQSGIDTPKVAIVSRPGEYGQDGAQGAKLAAEQLGLEVVDLEASIAGDDFTPIVSTLISEDPDLVWITSSPSELAQIIGGAAAGGLDAIWSGNSPSYNVALLDSEVASALDEFYFHSTYAALWGANDSTGMQDMMSTMQAENPQGTYAEADSYYVGWTQAMLTEAILELAAENGDMTRAGVVAAANEVSIDFQGLAPDQLWYGDPNDYVVRASYIYDVVLDNATPGTSITEDGGSGLVLLKDNWVGNVAADFTYTGPCFVSEG